MLLRGDFGRIEIGAGANVQETCVVHTFPNLGVTVEPSGHIGHGAVLHGCRIGRNAMVGMNAVVMDGAEIGENSIVAAMAFVKAGAKIPPRSRRIAVVTVDNPPVNALSQALRQALWDAADALDTDTKVDAVVLICAGRTFIAGADVAELGKPPAPPHLPDLVARIESADKPWTAAIHGSALGGGFEVALGCRFRIAVPTAAVGLPEVTCANGRLCQRVARNGILIQPTMPMTNTTAATQNIARQPPFPARRISASVA